MKIASVLNLSVRTLKNDTSFLLHTEKWKNILEKSKVSEYNIVINDNVNILCNIICTIL